MSADGSDEWFGIDTGGAVGVMGEKDGAREVKSLLSLKVASRLMGQKSGSSESSSTRLVYEKSSSAVSMSAA